MQYAVYILCNYTAHIIHRSARASGDSETQKVKGSPRGQRNQEGGERQKHMKRKIILFSGLRGSRPCYTRAYLEVAQRLEEHG